MWFDKGDRMTSPIDFAMSREEVAAELGISRSRVEQIEKNALRKLGRRMERYVKPREPKRAPVVNPEEESWERKYDRLYRLACGQSGSINQSGNQGEAAENG